jgi:hypothetical protein
MTLQSLGDMELRVDELDKARARFEEALPIFRAVGDRQCEADTLKNLRDLKLRADELSNGRASKHGARPRGPSPSP